MTINFVGKTKNLIFVKYYEHENGKTHHSLISIEGRKNSMGIKCRNP